MSIEPTKNDVLSIADYLGCNGGELWSEVSKLLVQQDSYSRINELEHLDSRSFMSLGKDSVYEVYQSDIDRRIGELKGDK